MRRFTGGRRATKAQLSYLKQMEKGARKNYSKFKSSLKPKFIELGAEIAVIAEGSVSLRRAFAGDSSMVDLILDAFSWSTWVDRSLGPIWDKGYSNSADQTYSALNSFYGVDLGVNLPDPLSVQIIAAGGKRLGLLDLRGDTKSALFKVLAEAREQNLGPIEIGRLIREYVSAGRFTGLEASSEGAGVNARAEMIARTEIRYAQALSVAEIAHDAGFESFIAFDNLTGFDDEECVARDGQVFSYDEMLDEDASEHPNGTLSWAPLPGSQTEEA